MPIWFSLHHSCETSFATCYCKSVAGGYQGEGHSQRKHLLDKNVWKSRFIMFLVILQEEKDCKLSFVKYE